MISNAETMINIKPKGNGYTLTAFVEGKYYATKLTKAQQIILLNIYTHFLDENFKLGRKEE